LPLLPPSTLFPYTTLFRSRVFDINVFGVMRMTNAVLPQMRTQGGGRIINISSVLGFLPAPYGAVYAATKHAIEGYSESLDHEVQIGRASCRERVEDAVAGV